MTLLYIYQGKVSYEKIESEVDKFLAIDNNLPQAWFVRSLNCAHHGHYQQAFDAHYKYFDYAATHGGPNTLLYGSSLETKQQVNWKAAKIQLHVAQYAVLNKARLHFQVSTYTYIYIDI